MQNNGGNDGIIIFKLKKIVWVHTVITNSPWHAQCRLKDTISKYQDEVLETIILKIYNGSKKYLHIHSLKFGNFKLSPLHHYSIWKTYLFAGSLVRVREKDKMVWIVAAACTIQYMRIYAASLHNYASVWNVVSLI